MTSPQFFLPLIIDNQASTVSACFCHSFRISQLGFRASDDDATRSGAARRRIPIRRSGAPQVLLSQRRYKSQLQQVLLSQRREMPNC